MLQVFFEQRDFRCTDLLRDFDAQFLARKEITLHVCSHVLKRLLHL